MKAISSAGEISDKSNRNLLFVGIDVAFAKGKRLPVSVCAFQDGHLEPVFKSRFPAPPIGKGNVAALKGDDLSEFARQTLAWLNGVEQLTGMQIGRIAIDAPKMPATPDRRRREAERAMDRLGISCFATPTEAAFNSIRQKAREHIAAGRPEAKLPHSNQIWMLVGFELFRVLGDRWECIEVFPQAIVQTLSAAREHKSTREGLEAQTDAIANVMNMDAADLREILPDISFGSPHDRLDALMSAWVASLDEDKRTPLGSPPDDAIWVPKIEDLARAESVRQVKQIVAKQDAAERPKSKKRKTESRKSKGTTEPGYVNRNSQRVVRPTGKPGTDHRQFVYKLRCQNCGHSYGANGSDVWQRRCPKCQNGRPGLKFDAPC